LSRDDLAHVLERLERVEAAVAAPAREPSLPAPRYGDTRPEDEPTPIGERLARIEEAFADIDRARGPPVSDEIMRRLRSVEEAVATLIPPELSLHAPHEDRRLTAAQVARRYGITRRSLDRWLATPKMGFPPPDLRINQRRYWDEAHLIRWDRARLRQSLRQER